MIQQHKGKKHNVFTQHFCEYGSFKFVDVSQLELKDILPRVRRQSTQSGWHRTENNQDHVA